MKFIHFGCWNNGLCSATNTNGLSLTMRKLNSYLETNPVDWIVVAGDNYYPKKNSVGKIFNQEEFESGFNCLPKSITKYLIFGNHDIDDVIVEADTEVKCKLLNSQQLVANRDLTIKIFNDVLYKRENSTLVIMLDTNLYTWTNLSTKVSSTCYSQLFNSLVNKSNLTIGNLANYQNCFVKDLIKSNDSIDNIIFIGHHPIYSIKSKSGKKIVNKLENFINFFLEIKEVLLDKQIYYLCADTHLYQKGKVQIDLDLSIEQYIVGTGGAEQDTPYLLDNEIREDGKIVYVKDVDIKNYGFLTVNIEHRIIDFEFVQADNLEMTGGFRKKYTVLNKFT